MQSPVGVAPGLSPAVTYSVRTIGGPPVVLTGNCNATLCQYQTNFPIDDNRPSNPFTVSVTLSNGIGGGQSVNAPFQGEFNIVHPCSLTTEYFFAVPIAISSLVTLTVVVIDSNAKCVSSSVQWFPRLDRFDSDVRNNA